MLYNHTICLQNGGYPMKKQAIALLLAAVLVLSGCGRQQLPEETPADMGLAAVAAIESHTPPALELTEAQTPPEEPVEEPEEPEEPDWSAGSSDYPWVRSGYAYYIRVNRSANVVTVYTAGDDGRYSVPYRAMVCSSGGSGTPLGDFSLDGWYRWEWLGLVGGAARAAVARPIRSFRWSVGPVPHGSYAYLAFELRAGMRGASIFKIDARHAAADARPCLVVIESTHAGVLLHADLSAH